MLRWNLACLRRTSMCAIAIYIYQKIWFVLFFYLYFGLRHPLRFTAPYKQTKIGRRQLLAIGNRQPPDRNASPKGEGAHLFVRKSWGEKQLFLFYFFSSSFIFQSAGRSSRRCRKSGRSVFFLKKKQQSSFDMQTGEIEPPPSASVDYLRKVSRNSYFLISFGSCRWIKCRCRVSARPE